VHSIQTVLRQSFGDFELIISDNSDDELTKKAMSQFSDPRIRYVRPVKILGMVDNFEFSVSHAKGEWVTVIGDDDALLQHGLFETHRLIEQVDTLAVSWCTAAWYQWPDSADVANRNVLAIPAIGSSSVRSSKVILQLLANAGNGYCGLPNIYQGCHHSSLIQTIKVRAGRIFGAMAPDVYSAFAAAMVTPSFLHIGFPVKLEGCSSFSNGNAHSDRTGGKSIDEIQRLEFSRLNHQDGIFFHPWVPNVPVTACAVADGFLQARQRLSLPNRGSTRFSRKAFLRTVTKECRTKGARFCSEVKPYILESLSDDTSLSHWFESYFEREVAIPWEQGNLTSGRSERELASGLTVVDCDRFGVTNIADAAQLFEDWYGYAAYGVSHSVSPVESSTTALWKSSRIRLRNLRNWLRNKFEH